MPHQSKVTTDHDVIQEWTTTRGGHPAKTETTLKNGAGMLYILFMDTVLGVGAISWKSFFTIFEKYQLAFLYQDLAKDGSVSHLCKFVYRDDHPDGEK